MHSVRLISPGARRGIRSTQSGVQRRRRERNIHCSPPLCHGDGGGDGFAPACVRPLEWATTDDGFSGTWVGIVCAQLCNVRQVDEPPQTSTHCWRFASAIYCRCIHHRGTSGSHTCLQSRCVAKATKRDLGKNTKTTYKAIYHTDHLIRRLSACVFFRIFGIQFVEML